MVQFIFVNLGNHTIHDYNGHAVRNVTWEDAKKVWEDLRPRINLRQGGCQVAWRSIDRNRRWVYGSERNVPQGQHAEEVIFTNNNHNNLRMSAFFSRIKPCSNNRYGYAHGCMHFFNGGRKVGNLENCHFLPIACPEIADKGDYAVVFYLETSAPVGQRTDSSNLGRPGGRNTTPPGEHLLNNLMGFPTGSVVTSGGWMHIEGQGSMSQEDLLNRCVAAGIRKSNWNCTRPAVRANIVAHVKAGLRA